MIIPTAMHIEPVEADGKHWIDVTIGPHKLKRRGPFKDADAAKTAADRLIQSWRPKTPAVPAKNDTIVLFGKPVTIDSDEGRKFTTDCCRAAEGLLEDSELRIKYEIASDTDLNAISENPALIKAIRDERFRRVNSGHAARESAAKIFVRAPAVLGTILDDKSANPRHRIDSAQALRQTAHSGDSAETARDTERFVIRIDLSAAPGDGEVIEIVKDITPKPPQIESKIDGEVVTTSETSEQDR